MKEEQTNQVTEVENETNIETESSTTTETETETSIVPETETETVITDPSAAEILITSPVDPREMTILETEKGDIHIIHEITLGDAILSTLIMAMLISMVLGRVIRR